MITLRSRAFFERMHGNADSETRGRYRPDMRTIRRILAVLLGVFVLLLIIGLSLHGKKHKSSGQAGHSAQADRKSYLVAAGDYLASVNNLDKDLATAMAGASDGSTTLADIKNAIESDAGGEASKWDEVQDVAVPAGLGGVNLELRDCHRAHDAAFTELLAYWKDSDTSRIKRGSDLLQQAIVVTNSDIDDLTKVVAREQGSAGR